MDENVKKLLFSMIISALKDEPLNADLLPPITPESLKTVFLLAKKHDLAHLVAYAIEKNGLLNEKKPAIEGSIMTAVYRYEQQHHELERICELLEAEGIDFLPLKGSVLRDYYPEGWMRTSSDIDILVKEADFERARTAIVEKLGYRFEIDSTHDVSLFFGDNIHLEIHHTLIEDGLAQKASELLADVWQYTHAKAGKRYHKELADEAFYFYHIAHAAKHVENGGCGIRPLVDLYILDRLDGADPEKRATILQKSELEKFTAILQKINRVWFEGEAHDATSQKAERFILDGGVYGNTENALAIEEQKKGGRVGYLLSMVFLPYHRLKRQYPILEKHRWLMPLMQVRRWFRLIFCGRIKPMMNRLKHNESEAATVKDFLSEIGL